MSQENVETVRRVYEAAARRDAASVLVLYDAEVELDATRMGVGDLGVYRGHEGLRTLFSQFHEVWGEIKFDYDELIDAGRQVISVVTRAPRGQGSGIVVKQSFALAWTLRDSKVTRVVWFRSRAEALEAVGLSDSGS